MEGERRTMTIREMESRDLEELLPMEQASSLTPWSRKMFMDELTDPLASCLVLMVEDPSRPILAGFICFRSVGDESELLNLSVHPLHRRQGVGRRLMQFYLDRCAAQGIEKSHLEVSVSNEAAIGLYFSLSYEKVGMRKGFYQGRVDALLLMKRI
jgi:ribosomal-protein-alanine N-acetyltransferase